MKILNENIKKYREMPLLKGLSAAVLITTVAVAPPLLEEVTKFDLGSSVLAAHSGNGQNGNGDGGGGDGDGNKGGGGSGGNKGGKSDKGELFGDQVYLDRNDDGVPYVDDNECLRPIVSTSGELIPLLGDADETSGIDEGKLAVCVVLAAVEVEESDVCDVQPECLGLLEEVELGRVSVIRAPERVLDQQLKEVTKVVTDDNNNFWLDHGGRLVYGETTFELASTFDSPLVNLGMFRDYLNYGELLGTDAGVWEPGVGDANFDPSYNPLLAAAFGFAAGDDKFANPVDVEIISRAAKILFLADNTEFLPTLDGPVDYSESPVSNEKFLDFTGFAYNRANTFPGVACVGVTTGVVTSYQPMDIDTQILEPIIAITNIAGFAQAAEDARKVIAFVHTPADSGLFPPTATNVFVQWSDSVFETSGRACPL